ncbi:MAG TPA: sigma-70 family RNA polymerase sigma factor [Candidatus Eisenbacteria bacterium]|nr:sigma-70 family RNA polymerase sigma factor [Candidatus Eisenbacteria bacterium]
MSTPAPPGAKQEADVHWDEARAFLKRVVRKHFGRPDETQIDELTQEALVLLLRAVRREGARNLEGLMTVIGRRVVIDYIRNRQRWARIVQPMADDGPEPSDPSAGTPETFGDPDQRTRFVVLEYFQARSPKCHELALAFFGEEDWRRVATRLGQAYSAIRQQWSRCVKTLREAARSGTGLMLEWA